jgi:ParB family chromosome partitioning protein
MRKKGLGQGLSALLGENISYETKSPKTDLQKIHQVFTSQLSPSPYQPRKVFDEDEIQSLAQSIQHNGMLQPILVRNGKNIDEYEIIAGERRWRAAKKIGLNRIPIIIKDFTNEEALTMALVENLQRENLSPLEEALGYQTMVDQLQITHEEVGEFVGKSRAHVTNMLRLIQLPESVQVLLREGKLTAGHARVLVGSENVEVIAQTVVQKGLNVRQTEKLLQKAKGKEAIKKLDPSVAFEPKEKLIAQEPLSQELLEIQTFIEDRTGYNVRIQIKGEEEVCVTFSMTGMQRLDDFLAKLNTMS